MLHSATNHRCSIATINPLEARCTCDKVHRSDFPEAITATTQYGPRVQATVVYLTQHHMLPILRTVRIMRDTCGFTLSSGAVVRMIHTPAGNLAPTVARIADAVRDARVAHSDETGSGSRANSTGCTQPRRRPWPPWPGGFRRFRDSAGIPGDRHP